MKYQHEFDLFEYIFSVSFSVVAHCGRQMQPVISCITCTQKTENSDPHHELAGAAVGAARGARRFGERSRNARVARRLPLNAGRKTGGAGQAAGRRVNTRREV